MSRGLWDVEEGHLNETKKQSSGQARTSRGSAVWAEMQNMFRYYQDSEVGEAPWRSFQGEGAAEARCGRAGKHGEWSA